MSKLNADDLVTTLRRRARELMTNDGYNAQYVKVFERAAEVIEVNRRFLVSGEQFTIETVVANRLLRNGLAMAHGIIRKHVGRKHAGLKMIEGTLGATKEAGVGRHIIVMEVTAGKTREQLDEELRVVLDAYFAKGDSDGKQAEVDEVEEGPDDDGGALQSRNPRQQAARRVP